MKYKNKVILAIVFLIVFAVCYFLVLYKLDLVTRDFDDYRENPDCDRIEYADGYYQLENCAVYKLDKEKLWQSRNPILVGSG